MFKTWEQYSELEKAQSTYSDYHKSVYGFRPRGMSDAQWNSVEWLDAAIADLDRAWPAIEAEERAAEERCIAKLEARIADAIALGARDREAAIRWIDQAEGADGDREYLCYLVGVPYGYFLKAA